MREGDVFTPGKKTPLSTPEIEARRTKLAELKKQREGIRESIQPKPVRTAEEKYNQALKTRLTKEIADKMDRIARGDFDPKPKRPTPELSKESTALKAKAESVRQEWERQLIKARLAGRTKMQKFLDSAVKWRQAFVISGVKSIFKLASAAVEGMVILPAREAAGAVIGQIPGFRDIAAKASYEGGFNARAEAKAIAETWRNLIDDFGKNVKGDKPDFEKLYGGRETMPPELQNYVGFLHGALKSPLARNVYTRSLEKRMASAIDHGIDVTDVLVNMELNRKAWEDSSFWRFQNRNLLTSIFRQGMARMEKAGYTKSAAAIKTVFPVVSVPTNIVARLFESVAGLPMGAGKILSAAWKEKSFKQAVANLTPEQADLIMRNLKTGAIGTAFMLIGAFNPQSFGGYYQPGKKQKPDEVKFGRARVPSAVPLVGGKQIPSFLLHNPFLEAMQFGATMRKVADSKLRKKDKDSNGLWLGAWTAAVSAVSEQPFVREAEDIVKAGDPRQARRFIGEQVRSYAIPQAVQNVAEWMDTHDPNTGEPIKRDPRTVGQHIEMGIPGLRKEVPKAKATR
jgi:hypothetical protein